MVDRPGTTYSIQNEAELWPAAKASHLSKRADGTIRDRPGERMFSAHAGERQNSDYVEGSKVNPISDVNGEGKSRITATHLNVKHSSKQVNGESAQTQTGKILEINARRHQK